MCRPEADLAVVAVGEAHHLGTVVVPAARLVPELGRLQDGHEDFLGALGVHLLADDLLDLVEHAHAEGQKRVGARAVLADHAGAEQEPVARDVGARRVFLQRGRIRAAHLENGHGESLT